jgi:hypothetical protein
MLELTAWCLPFFLICCYQYEQNNHWPNSYSFTWTLPLHTCSLQLHAATSHLILKIWIKTGYVTTISNYPIHFFSIQISIYCCQKQDIENSSISHWFSSHLPSCISSNTSVSILFLCTKFWFLMWSISFHSYVSVTYVRNLQILVSVNNTVHQSLIAVKILRDLLRRSSVWSIWHGLDYLHVYLWVC